MWPLTLPPSPVQAHPPHPPLNAALVRELNPTEMAEGSGETTEPRMSLLGIGKQRANGLSYPQIKDWAPIRELSTSSATSD